MDIFSTFNPIPAFPAYTGPYKVGSRKIEVPVAQLASSHSSKSPDQTVGTVSFRLFYPCKPPGKNATSPAWLPEPQGEYLRAYYRFMQASPWLASLLSYVPLINTIQYTTIPATKDAEPESPEVANLERWPVLFFSHGLGGSSRAYSHIAGSLASHGIFVIAPDHRDGSAPIAFIKATESTPAATIDYKIIPHEHTAEVEEARNQQLRIRMYELEMIFQAILKIDQGEKMEDLLADNNDDSDLSSFQSRLDIHTAGRVAWAGHSFGAATTVQFVKSIFHGGSSLLTVPSTSSLTQQITPASPVVLLDLWGIPLSFSSSSDLADMSLPAYHTPTASSPLPPSRPLAILSEGFYKWSTNLTATLNALSPPSTSAIDPFIFYPIGAAHLSQSDFGILFPWLTGRFANAKEPERTLRLNMRAVLECLRRAGITVSQTSRLDMEIIDDHEGQDVPNILASADGQKGETSLAMGQDHKILARDGSVRGWIAVDPASELVRLARQRADGKEDVDTDGASIAPHDDVVSVSEASVMDGEGSETGSLYREAVVEA